MASDPGFPVRKVHARFRCATFPASICRKVEYLIAPGSFPNEGQSVCPNAEAANSSGTAIYRFTPSILAFANAPLPASKSYLRQNIGHVHPGLEMHGGRDLITLVVNGPPLVLESFH
jgi:hypothetical protein